MIGNGLIAAAVAAAGLVYVLAWRAEGRRWPLRHGLSWIAGIGVALVALSPPMSAYGHAGIEGHMVQHLLLGMYAPVALVYGAPVTLLLRRLHQEPARRVVGWLASRPLRAVAHPASAAVLDIGAMFLLYLTPLYRLMHTSPLLGPWLHLHFLVAGCLFAWSIMGPDPAPHRPGPRLRLIVLFLAMGLHGALSKYMYLHGYPLDVHDSLEARRAAAQLMFYGGDIAAIALAIGYFAQLGRPRHKRRSKTPAALADAGRS